MKLPPRYRQRAIAALVTVAGALIFYSSPIYAGPLSQPIAPQSICGATSPRAGESYPDYSARAKRDQCRKPWTILVYMAADNDLAPYALWDLYEMEAGFRTGRIAAGSTIRTDLVVQVSTPGQTHEQRLHIFQSPVPYRNDLTLSDFKARSLRDVESPVVDQVARTENGKPVPAALEFERFVEWGVQRYPAEHYMVVVWGHGQGWAPAHEVAATAGNRRFGGIGFSDSDGTFLDVPSLHHALRNVETRWLGGHPIDVYASDACLMQMVEVATEISDSARFITGSSQVENFLGLPYRRMMFEINTGHFSGERARMGVAGSGLEIDEPYLLARMLPRIFRMSLDTHGLHGRELPKAIETVTISSISSDELRGELLPALSNLAVALRLYLTEDPDRAIGINQMLLAAPTFMGGSQELGGFLALLRQTLTENGLGAERSADFSVAVRNLHDSITTATLALDRTVVAYALGTHYTGSETRLHLLGFRAVALWLPVSNQDFLQRIGDFSSSIFYRDFDGEWEKWLRALYPDEAPSLLNKI